MRIILLLPQFKIDLTNQLLRKSIAYCLAMTSVLNNKTLFPSILLKSIRLIWTRNLINQLLNLHSIIFTFNLDTLLHLLSQPLVNINPSFWANHSHDNLNLNENHIFESIIKSLSAKLGHTALICFHRTNLNYPPQPSPKSFNTVLTTNSQLFNPPEFSYPAMAHPTATHNTVPSTWFMESGATHHFTLDINILDTMTPFSGSNQVIVGNGKQLYISHLGTTKLPSSYSPLILH